MKKYIVITLLLFIANLSYSQKKATLGLNIGYSSSWGSEKSKSTSIMSRQNSSVESIVLGVSLNYRLSENISLQPELLYSQKGFFRDTDFNDGSLKYENRQKYSINYVSLPVLVKLNLTKKKAPFLLLGASPSLAVSSKYNYDTKIFSPTLSKESGSVDIANLNIFDVPLTFGIGIERPIGSNFINLHARYNQALISMFNNYDNKISSFNLILGFRF